MQPELYSRFVALNVKGSKAEAKSALAAFIASFGSDGEKIAWTFPFLRDWEMTPEPRINIRYELYRDLVFPVLLSGYNRGDAAATVWLAKTIQNLRSDRNLWAKINDKSGRSLLEEAFEIKPTEETRRLLLAEYVQRLRDASLDESLSETRRNALTRCLARARELDVLEENQHLLFGVESLLAGR